MAGPVTFSVKVVRNDLGKISAQGHRKVSQACTSAAYAAYRFSIPPTPVDQGDLYTRVRLDTPAGGTSSSVTWLMPYAIYQEGGTTRGVKAKHFAKKGFEQARPRFEHDLANAYKG